MYGRTALQEELLTGRRELTRHFYGDGRWGHMPHRRPDAAWQVAKHRPKTQTWAISTGGRARKVHAVRYQLTATHRAGHVLYLTVWLCGGTAHSQIEPVPDPSLVCAGCHAAISKVTEVAL